jgi:hypothetical protein
MGRYPVAAARTPLASGRFKVGDERVRGLFSIGASTTAGGNRASAIDDRRAA